MQPASLVDARQQLACRKGAHAAHDLEGEDAHAEPQLRAWAHYPQRKVDQVHVWSGVQQARRRVVPARRRATQYDACVGLLQVLMWNVAAKAWET
jgi:hypothetical protein